MRRDKDRRRARRGAHQRGGEPEPLSAVKEVAMTTDLVDRPISRSSASILTDAARGAIFRTVRVSGHLAPRGQSSEPATSAFEASVQQPAASAQVEPRDSRAAPQPKRPGRMGRCAVSFPQNLLRAHASLRALEGTRPMPIDRAHFVSTRTIDSSRLCGCVAFSAQSTP